MCPTISAVFDVSKALVLRLNACQHFSLSPIRLFLQFIFQYNSQSSRNNPLLLLKKASREEGGWATSLIALSQLINRLDRRREISREKKSTVKEEQEQGRDAADG
ncbi:hypothetical protein V1478_007313 [Vespula squamosa]|uniref:Uncharacterized protein n=1 Tax=Vespula squamosa TaxID=30214 RepID=A0ABD2B2U5_VESSQ